MSNPLYRCPECGHLCTCGEHARPATFNRNAEFAGLVLLVDQYGSRRRNQYGRCGQTYTEPEAKR